VLLKRAAELEADGDVDPLDGEGEWDDDREYGEGEDAAELFGGSEYDAVVRLQERAASGKAAHMGKRASVKNPKYPKNPKWKGNSASASASRSSTTKTSSTTRVLAASTQIIVGSPTASSKTTTTAKPSSSSASKTTTSKTTTSTKLSLPTASSGCPAMYTTTTGGAIYGPQVGTGAAASAFLPVPSTFVVRSKNKLYLDGQEFRIAGPSTFSFLPFRSPHHSHTLSNRHLLARTRRERQLGRLVSWQEPDPGSDGDDGCDGRKHDSSAYSRCEVRISVSSHLSFDDADFLLPQHRAQQNSLADRLQHQRGCCASFAHACFPSLS
jgi:hypothetical protein